MRKLIFHSTCLLLCFWLAGCKKHLPETIPDMKALEFSGSKEGWPPRPKGALDIKEVPFEVIEREKVSSELQEQLKAIAIADKKVKEVLGTNYALLDVFSAELPKATSQAISLYTLSYYSYTQNLAVNVQSDGRSVVSVNSIRDFQPVESNEEIESASRLVIAQSPISDKVKGLRAKGIITEMPRGTKGHGHRVLYLSYLKNATDDLPLYYALVDLTKNTILETGSL
ncbi:MAG: hypothetical protein ACKVU2_16680 [Saprospiraceae bacterium]